MGVNESSKPHVIGIRELDLDESDRTLREKAAHGLAIGICYLYFSIIKLKIIVRKTE
jgi:hypothetical protein